MCILFLLLGSGFSIVHFLATISFGMLRSGGLCALLQFFSAFFFFFFLRNWTGSVRREDFGMGWDMDRGST